MSRRNHITCMYFAPAGKDDFEERYPAYFFCARCEMYLREKPLNPRIKCTTKRYLCEANHNRWDRPTTLLSERVSCRLAPNRASDSTSGSDESATSDTDGDYENNPTLVTDNSTSFTETPTYSETQECWCRLFCRSTRGRLYRSSSPSPPL